MFGYDTKEGESYGSLFMDECVKYIIFTGRTYVVPETGKTGLKYNIVVKFEDFWKHFIRSNYGEQFKASSMQMTKRHLLKDGKGHF
jgi:hypothetical protein